MLPSFSTVETPDSTSFPASSSPMPKAISTDTSAPGTTSAAMADSTSRRFSSSLLISIFQPQPGGEPHVLSLSADGKRELRIVYVHLHVLLDRVDDADTADFGGAKRVRGEHHRVFRELDDVDFLPAQFANDGLHPHAFHTHTGAHAVHVTIAAVHGDFCAFTGLSRAALEI